MTSCCQTYDRLTLRVNVSSAGFWWQPSKLKSFLIEGLKKRRGFSWNFRDLNDSRFPFKSFSCLFDDPFRHWRAKRVIYWIFTKFIQFVFVLCCLLSAQSEPQGLLGRKWILTGGNEFLAGVFDQRKSIWKFLFHTWLDSEIWGCFISSVAIKKTIKSIIMLCFWKFVHVHAGFLKSELFITFQP